MADGGAEWSTPADGKVWSVVTGGGSVFAVGRFETIGGRPNRVAAVWSRERARSPEVSVFQVVEPVAELNRAAKSDPPAAR